MTPRFHYAMSPADAPGVIAQEDGSDALYDRRQRSVRTAEPVMTDAHFAGARAREYIVPAGPPLEDVVGRYPDLEDDAPGKKPGFPWAQAAILWSFVR